MKEKKLLAFHGKKEIKEKYIARVKTHQKADEIIHGIYWEDGKGCAVGCTIESSTDPHQQMEKELGIPKELAYLEDWMFEELENGESKKFPLKFLEAIPVGADLSKVCGKFVIWQFEDKKEGMSQITEIKEDKETMDICKEVVSLYKRKLKGDNPTEKEWIAVAEKADNLYWARAGAGAWARAWAGAGAGARAWAGAWAGAGARAWAWGWDRAWDRAWAGEEYKKELLKDEKKLLDLLKEAK